MLRVKQLLVAASIMLLAACVTINVYFPAAAAEKAADEFVRDVLGGQQNEGAFYQPEEHHPGIAAYLAALVLNGISNTAHAQANIEINTPQINAIKARMAQRQSSQLSSYFDVGAIGFSNDGLVSVRDRSAVSLKERRNLEALVAEENRDRQAVYREIAVANGHPEWEADIRDTFARQWISNAKAGWYYQNAEGEWVAK